MSSLLLHAVGVLVGWSVSQPSRPRAKKKKTDLLFEDPSEPSQGTRGLLHLLPWWQDPAFTAFRNSQNTELTVSFCCSRPSPKEKTSLLSSKDRRVNNARCLLSGRSAYLFFPKYNPAFNLLFIDSDILNPLFTCQKLFIRMFFSSFTELNYWAVVK